MGYNLKRLEAFADDRALFHKSAWGMSITDKHNTILDFNPAWEKMFGYEKKELVGTSELSLVHSADSMEFSEHIDRLLRHEVEQFSKQMRWQAKNGSYRWLLFSCIGFFNKDEELLYRVNFFQDMQEYKRKEDIAHEALLSRIRTLRTLIHDLNNEVNKIQLASTFIKDLGNKHPEISKYLDIINKACERTLEINREYRKNFPPQGNEIPERNADPYSFKI